MYKLWLCLSFAVALTGLIGIGVSTAFYVVFNKQLYDVLSFIPFDKNMFNWERQRYYGNTCDKHLIKTNSNPNRINFVEEWNLFWMGDSIKGSIKRINGYGASNILSVCLLTYYRIIMKARGLLASG